MPTVHIIGIPVEKVLPVTVLIGLVYTVTYPATVLIYHPETHSLPLFQEIVSQMTINDYERRLNHVIREAKQVDLTDINAKLKIVAHSIKKRYEQTQNKQTPPNQRKNT